MTTFVADYRINGRDVQLYEQPSEGTEVLEVLRELQRTGNQTLIMVTHNPQLAALADRQLRLEQLGVK
jgi:ABC-type lipoprotein export system ATPase subunit